MKARSMENLQQKRQYGWRKLTYLWRVVNGESKSIHSYLYAISTIHMGNAASDWDLL